MQTIFQYLDTLPLLSIILLTTAILAVLILLYLGGCKLVWAIKDWRFKVRLEKNFKRRVW